MTMSKGTLAVLGLAAAVAIGTMAAVLEDRAQGSEGEGIELADEGVPPREDDVAAVLAEEDDDAGDGDGTGGDDGTNGGNNTGPNTTRGGRGTGGATTGGKAGDTT